jgi:hypothetical protein
MCLVLPINVWITLYVPVAKLLVYNKAASTRIYEDRSGINVTQRQMSVHLILISSSDPQRIYPIKPEFGRSAALGLKYSDY